MSLRAPGCRYRCYVAHPDEWAKLFMDDPVRHKQFLMRTSLIDSVRKAAKIA